MNMPVGNVTFVSNLYPVKEKLLLRYDTEYLQHIEDPERLFEMRKSNPFYNFKYFNFTKRQMSIFYVQSGYKCKYADDGDMPFGAIVDSDGLVKEVCKCKKTQCRDFHICKEGMAE